MDYQYDKTAGINPENYQGLDNVFIAEASAGIYFFDDNGINGNRGY
jgi:hypothetical protein